MLLVLTTHPIQYQAPLWRSLTESGVDLEVSYLSDHGQRASFDREFEKAFSWDLDLRSGYRHRFLPGRRNGSVARFFGTRLPDGWPPAGPPLPTAVWIQGWQTRAYWQAAWRVAARGIPVWLRGETNDLRPRPMLKELVRGPLIRALFRRVDRFLCIGTANRRMYLEQGVSPGRLAWAPYCIDNARFAAAAAALRPHRREIRRAFGVPDDAWCVLFAGKLVEKKRPLNLVAAISRLGPDPARRPVHLLVAGSGPLEGQLRARCSVVGGASGGRPGTSSGPSTTLAGFLNQSRMPEAYAAADCLALPSDHGETWGLVVNEAMACGLPCVVSDACGCAEDLVRPLSDAFVFALGDTADLARALRRVRDGPPDRRSIAETVARHAPEVTVATVKQLLSGSPRVKGAPGRQRALRFLFVVPGGVFAGAERVSLDLMRTLSSRGHAVTCATSAWGDGELARRLDAESIAYRRLRLGFISKTPSLRAMKMTLHQVVFLPSLGWRFRRLVGDSRPDLVVHANFHHAVLLLPFSPRGRTIFHVHDLLPDSRFYRAVFSMLSRRIWRFVCVSMAAAEHLRALGVPAAQTRTIYNGTEIPPARTTARRPGAGIVFGIGGRLAPWKGYETLLDAMTQLTHGFPGAVCLVAGSGQPDYVAHLEREIEVRGLTDRVHLLGFQTDMSAFYDRIDVGLVPSFTESLSLAAIEASAHGLPVIASRVGGLSEVVVDGTTGLLVEPGNPASLLAAMQTYAEQPELARAHARAARQRARRCFSLRAMADRFESLARGAADTAGDRQGPRS